MVLRALGSKQPSAGLVYVLQAAQYSRGLFAYWEPPSKAIRVVLHKATRAPKSAPLFQCRLGLTSHSESRPLALGGGLEVSGEPSSRFLVFWACYRIFIIEAYGRATRLNMRSLGHGSWGRASPVDIT